MIRATTNRAKSLATLKVASDQPIYRLNGESHPAATVVGFPGRVGLSFCKLLGRLRFRHLSLLVALDEHRNLHRAARAVHLAQPSASKLVQDLESLFGSPLFDRLPTGMQPTELGAVVLAFARHALGDLKRLATDLDHRRAGRDGHLVIGTTTDLLPDVVANAMAEMKQCRPMLAVQLVGDRSDEVIDRLREGQVDMALGYFADIPGQSDIEYEHLGKETCWVVARREQRLEQAAWIFHSLMSSTPRGMKAPANVVECNSLAMTLNLVLKSDAITMLPESVVRGHVEAGQMVRLGVGGGSIEWGMLTRRGEALCVAAVEFRELLRRFGDCSDKDVGATPIKL